MQTQPTEIETVQVLVERNTLRENLERVREQILRAAARAGRRADDVQLIAVTKSVDVPAAQTLVDLGVTHLAENRIEQALAKLDAVAPRPVWHMIGNIQRRKVREIVERFDRVDAVDRLSLAEEIEKRCAAIEKTMPVLLEVNVSGEAAKHGFTPEELPGALERLSDMPHLRVEGVMTMAPATDNPEETRPVFARLRALADIHGLGTLSMGMTNDFEIAIEEGSTEVRIGTALFK